MIATEEWIKKQEIETKANLLQQHMSNWSKYDQLRAVEEVYNMLAEFDERVPMVRKDRELLERTALSFKKVFKIYENA